MSESSTTLDGRVPVVHDTSLQLRAALASADFVRLTVIGGGTEAEALALGVFDRAGSLSALVPVGDAEWVEAVTFAPSVRFDMVTRTLEVRVVPSEDFVL